MLLQLISWSAAILIVHFLLPSEHGVRKSLVAICIAVVLGVMVS